MQYQRNTIRIIYYENMSAQNRWNRNIFCHCVGYKSLKFITHFKSSNSLCTVWKGSYGLAEISWRWAINTTKVSWK